MQKAGKAAKHPCLWLRYPSVILFTARCSPARSYVICINGHARAVDFFGGLPKIFRPEDTKTGIKSPKTYERQAGQLMDLRERYLQELRETPKAAALVDPLFENPYLTTARAQEILGVTHPTAQTAINQLVRHGALQEVSGREWGRIYLATAIADALENPP